MRQSTAHQPSLPWFDRPEYRDEGMCEPFDVLWHVS